MAGGAHVRGPDGALDFADVRLAQQKHAQAGLADTAADGLREFSRDEPAVEVKVLL